MISFFPPTDACGYCYSREPQPQPQRQRQRQRDQQQKPQQQQQQTQQQQQQDHGLALNCPCQHAVLDYPATLQLLAGANPPGGGGGSGDNVYSNAPPYEPMQPDAWGTVSRFTPKFGCFPHRRESSISSLGSAGPASPFAGNACTSSPQIAVTDSPVDRLADMQPHDASGVQGSSYYQFTKPNAYAGYHNLESVMPELAYPMTIPGPNKRPRADRSLLPPPDFAGGGSNQSRPASVASSIVGDSPATPTVGDADQLERRRNDYGNVPELNRTMTDVYGDELYSPDFAITSTSSPQQHMAASPNSNDVFSQRINTANSHHLSAAAHSPSPTISRTRSPFRMGSPFASSPGRELVSHGNFAFNTAQQLGEKNKARQDASFLQQRVGRGPMEPETPRTISPKDAVLEFNEVDGEATFQPIPRGVQSLGMDPAASKGDDSCMGLVAAATTATDPLSLVPCRMSSGVQAPLHYPVAASHGTRRLSSSASSSAASGKNTPTNVARPSGTSADGGTYTCTYHGCTLRFDTPSILQKHKREGHRQSQGLGGLRETGMTPGLLNNTQAGPHRCDRINPSTGKPCNTVFSRPYDLTRHEDTIHNARKQKVRCDLCTEEKTFSRGDALTRHYRVCHPDVELAGKHRRRAGG